MPPLKQTRRDFLPGGETIISQRITLSGAHLWGHMLLARFLINFEPDSFCRTNPFNLLKINQMLLHRFAPFINKNVSTLLFLPPNNHVTCHITTALCPQHVKISASNPHYLFHPFIQLYATFK